MIACKQVARALANHRYDQLPWWRRLPLFTHIKLCVMCGKYHRQVIDMQKGFKNYLEHEEAGDVDLSAHLSDEARERIKTAMKESP